MSGHIFALRLPAVPLLRAVLIAAGLAIVIASSAAPVLGQTEVPFQLPCRDGYKLDGKILYPADVEAATAQRVIILNHGSGANSMDEDLTTVTKGGKENLFFRDVAQSLAGAGFTVIRYHKRSYQVQEEFKQNPAIRDEPGVQAFVANPLKYFVDDALDCVKFAHEKCPSARVYLLGHSVGTYVSLQAAQQDESIAGVALIGFYATSTEYLLFEQHIERPARQFTMLDANHDGLLAGEELKADNPLAQALAAQLPIMDLDADSQLSLSEFQAASLSSLLMTPLIKAVDFRVQEAAYPRVHEILRDAKFKVAFFQGLWDNQTQAYHAQAIELLAKNAWGQADFHFHFFPKLGHALDLRTDYGDMAYDTVDAAALQALTKELTALFD